MCVCAANACAGVRRLFPKKTSPAGRCAAPLDAGVRGGGYAALRRILLHGISPDVLTIKGQQNADYKEKAMSRRKGHWYFRSS